MCETTPKVSVCVVTYNQEKYIRQCLQSLVEQETDFLFEVVVSDDCSTDGTKTIVQEFATKYPGIVKPIFNMNNIGAFKNFLLVHENATGEYIAHMDGDDYALPNKLQIQANVLDADPSCQIVWHRMQLLDNSRTGLLPQAYDKKKILGAKITADDIISNITIGFHSSKMYRRWNRKDFKDISALDFSENVCHLCDAGGYAIFIDDLLGVYRSNLGISKNTRVIRNLIYVWLLCFYYNHYGDRGIVAAKILLMALSDLKHGCGSFWFGLKALLKVSSSISMQKIRDCRSRRMQVLTTPDVSAN